MCLCGGDDVPVVGWSITLHTYNVQCVYSYNVTMCVFLLDIRTQKESVHKLVPTTLLSEELEPEQYMKVGELWSPQAHVHYTCTHPHYTCNYTCIHPHYICTYHICNVYALSHTCTCAHTIPPSLYHYLIPPSL